MADSSGSVAKRIEYMPFGSKRLEVGTYNSIKQRFTGQYEDEESGLYYYQQRYYDSTLSRFVTADPLYLEEIDKRGVDSQELNLYAYVRNNPVKYVDSNGEAAHWPYTIGIGAVIGGTSAYFTASQSGITGGDLVRATAIGVATGAAQGALPSKAIYGAFGSMLFNAVSQVRSGTSIRDLSIPSILISGGASVLGSGVGQVANKYLQYQPSVIGNTISNLQGTKFSDAVVGSLFGGASSAAMDIKGQEFNKAFMDPTNSSSPAAGSDVGMSTQPSMMAEPPRSSVEMTPIDVYAN